MSATSDPGPNTLATQPRRHTACDSIGGWHGLPFAGCQRALRTRIRLRAARRSAARDRPTDRRAAPGRPSQVLLGVTGSGKTFTMAQVLAAVNRPALVMVHNKTLAAQLYQEFRRFFPENAVEFFVSYYDYYQPEAYMPATDSYIEKEAIINEEIDRLRLSATRSLFERRDVIIVASVSCIYGLGSPEAVLRPAGAARARADDRRATRSCASSSRFSTSATTTSSRAARSACAATSSRSTRRTTTSACASACSATRSTSSLSFDPLTGREVRRHDRIAVYPEVALRRAARADDAGDRAHQGGTDRAARRARAARAACSRRSASTSGRCSTSR